MSFMENQVKYLVIVKHSIEVWGGSEEMARKRVEKFTEHLGDAGFATENSVVFCPGVLNSEPVLLILKLMGALQAFRAIDKELVDGLRVKLARCSDIMDVLPQPEVW